MTDDERNLWHDVFIALCVIPGVYEHDCIRWANAAVAAFRAKNAEVLPP